MNVQLATDIGEQALVRLRRIEHRTSNIEWKKTKETEVRPARNALACEAGGGQKSEPLNPEPLFLIWCLFFYSILK